jgi:hypothetical protein
MAEEEGRRRGCTRAVLSTIHFQAPVFYLKQGWEVAARIECEPPGHTRFYMTKKLLPDEKSGEPSTPCITKGTPSWDGSSRGWAR